MPLGLMTLLERCDPSLSRALRPIYEAAALGIVRLGELDLVRYETSALEAPADLSMWEEMAPLLGATLEDVNAVVALVQAQFPQAQLPEDGQGVFLKVSDALHQHAASLSALVSEFGAAVRSPQVVSDRWNLLAELQTFRTRFRGKLGNLVYGSAELLGEGTHKDLVPGFAEDVEVAVAVRATLADLQRLLIVRAAKVREAPPQGVQPLVKQLEKELDVFGRTPAYRALAVPSKKAVLERRHVLSVFAANATTPKEKLQVLVDELLAVAQGAAAASPDILAQHDREAWASLGVGLEQLDECLRQSPAHAATLLGSLFSRALALYGNAPDLDEFLRRLKKEPLAKLPPEQVRMHAERFRELLAGVVLADA
ncbi:MAG: hypothetical protein ACKVPX_06875 [Myxococcaceae bacterium]